jgi:hypothetical protein
MATMGTERKSNPEIGTMMPIKNRMGESAEMKTFTNQRAGEVG